MFKSKVKTTTDTTTTDTKALSRLMARFVTEGDGYGHSVTRVVIEPKAADLLISRTRDPDLHLPCIDIDFDAELVPSRTEGHFHLYFNRPISWDRYRRLLDALYECEYIQAGWYQQSIRDAYTTVRRPPIEDVYDRLRRKIEETGALFDDDSREQ